MKRSVSLFVMLAMAVVYARAQQVEMAEAKRMAAEFLNQQPVSQTAKARGYSARAVTADDLQLADMRKDGHDKPALYVFNRSGRQGYVIAAADKQAEAILGYSHVGSFDPDNVPCCLKYLLDDYARQITYAREHPKDVKARTRAADRAPIAPLVKSQWDQMAPYNNNCPTIGGEHCLTGCVATAMAQILYYHKWPERSKGGKYGYEWNGQTVSTVFGEKEYRYDKMKDTYDSSQPSADDHYVAELMYDCGVSVNMGYGMETSAAYVEGMQFPMFFDYSSGYWHLWLTGLNLDEVMARIYNELSHQRPMLISGASYIGDGGHEFICDGYAAGDYLHFNFGWSGYLDDYFLLTAIAPSGNDFRYYQEIIGGLVPMRDVEQAEVDGIGYDIMGDEAFLTNGSAAKGSYTIPETIVRDGVTIPVKGLGSKAFKNNTNITSVTIPATLESMMDSAFAGCTKLKELRIEDGSSMLFMQWDSFYGMNQIENLYLGRVGSYAIYFDGVKKLAVGANVTEEYLLSSNLVMGYNLQELTVSEDNPYLSAVDNVLFDKNQTRLIVYPMTKTSPNYDIPATVKTIESMAFNNNYELYSIHIPASVETIGNTAFVYCFNLSDFQVDADNKHFVQEDHTLYTSDKKRILYFTPRKYNSHKPMMAYEMPEAVTTIDDYAFYYGNFTAITLSEQLDSIGACAFMYGGDNTLESITLPASVSYMGDGAFAGVNAKAIYVSPDNQQVADIDGVMFDKACQKLMCMPGGRRGDYEVPANVTTIGRRAFFGSQLSAVFLPRNVEKLEWSAFYDTPIDSLIVENEYPAECEWGALDGFYEKEYNGTDWVITEPSIFVPAGSLLLYRANSEWGSRPNIYEMTAEEMNQWRLTNDIRDIKTSQERRPHKVIDKGRIYIIHDNKVYTVKGVISAGEP